MPVLAYEMPYSYRFSWILESECQILVRNDMFKKQKCHFYMKMCTFRTKTSFFDPEKAIV